MRNLILFIVFSLPLISLAGERPDQKLTPGAVNPAVTQENIDTTICVKGWTKTIRPPSSYTTKWKVRQIEQYELADTDKKSYEEDHLISLELGGAPRDPKNLWPEPWEGDWNAHKKDRLENKLHDLVCQRQVTLVEAQKAIAEDWIGAYHKYVDGQSK